MRHSSHVRSLVLAALVTALSACEADGGPESGVAIDVNEITQVSFEITVRNTGDFQGRLTGCGGPTTAVQHWDGDSWNERGSLNHDCAPNLTWERTLQPRQEFAYTVDVGAEGRFRFAVSLLIENQSAASSGWSHAVGL